MRYYNNTSEPIPYVVSDYKDYTLKVTMNVGHYLPIRPMLTKKYAIFTDGSLHWFFLRSDFNKLTKVP